MRYVFSGSRCLTQNKVVAERGTDTTISWDLSFDIKPVVNEISFNGGDNWIARKWTSQDTIQYNSKFTRFNTSAVWNDSCASLNIFDIRLDMAGKYCHKMLSKGTPQEIITCTDLIVFGKSL